MIISVEAKMEDMGIVIDELSSAAEETFKHAFFHTGKTIQSHWIDLAQSNLKTSRADYVDGLRKAESYKAFTRGTDTLVIEIQLIGKMPNAFEFGMDAFDMKSVRPGWLGGGKAKTGKDGKMYVTIPFRHSTTSGARLAYSGKAARANMQQELKKTVKQYGLDRMIRSSSGAIVSGPVARVPKSPSIHRYLHGLTKIQKPGAGGRPHSSQLMTWRRISENSPADKWQHPGIEAKNLLPRVGQYADQELERILANMFLAGGS